MQRKLGNTVPNQDHPFSVISERARSTARLSKSNRAYFAFLFVVLSGAVTFFIFWGFLHLFPTTPPPTAAPTPRSPTVAPTYPPYENITVLKALNVPLFTIGGPMGGTCNQLHGISLAVAHTVRNNGLLIVWGDYKRIFDRLDLDYMRVNYPQLKFVLWDHMPPKMGGYHAGEGTACGLRHSYDWIKYGVRPKPEFRRQAEEYINELRGKAEVVVSVRLRYFEDLCTQEGNLTRLSWLQEGRPCHSTNQDFVVDVDRLCRYRLDRFLIDTMESEWPEVRNAKDFAAFVSTDDQRPKYTSEFFDENYANQFKFKAAKRSPPDTNMLVDMWAATIADYYIGNPMSSCEPIIAQWRELDPSKRGGKVHPSRCFKGFGLPQPKFDPKVHGIC